MRILLFTGKGGVGKTTLAAATAARLAARGERVLAVSTDPAHSLADALGVPLGPEPREIPLGMHAAEVQTRGLVDKNWAELREHLRTMLLAAGIAELEAEELTLLPGVEDLLALAEVHRLAASGLWDAVIVDCGPTAETLRLLALPESVSGYLERLFPAHRRVVRGMLAGMAGSENVQRWDAAAEALSRLAERLTALREMLADPGTGVRLVLTPESVVAAETRRTLTALALQRIRVDGLVANRLVPNPGAARGEAANWMRTRRREQEAVLDSVRAATDVPLRTVEHRAAEPVGVEALRELADELYGGSDPLAAGEDIPDMQVTGGGRALDSEYSLRIALPLHEDAELDLARIADEIAVTVDGRRRLIALPAVLRRCVVTSAVAGDDGLTIGFRPDPDQWMR
ncbi:arsenite efflux ATP-binding protein ArsA [Saccharopolyspora erythraea NRRL 2338]|uniref:Arsenite-transporting ATPase n=2 Tax=Saccharopolyspora erythraea TaxID=1836 RepID=A4FAE1_SACEN|nr:ArsA family ATPase [Saccharopolyspora erythraea]EQD86395.1 arsenic ABC transporter ATPase [Saccharopolyspora erythraea D]PFG94802.1 arsenite efflux ATP-binding protein ArsA [Saccharopolyspora erythraea NRRL 2338]QRK91517.1 ArsA family ATPase [Saccharopolyspora erythraea]CAM01016.1 arsenite-transporting ATPase [Saccharopolyspora erythraea NRRL 2338]